MRELTNYEYEYLFDMAQVGAAAIVGTDAGALAKVQGMRETADARNSINRYTLVIRWQSVPQGVVSTKEKEYPATQTRVLTQIDTMLTRDDVMEAVRGEATTPALIHVTKDPQGLVGWTELDEYDFSY